MSALNSKPAGTVQIGGAPWLIQGAGNPYSFATDGSEYRFEARRGDCWAGAGDDPAQRIRSEIAAMEGVPAGRTSMGWFDMMIEPGPITSAEWTSICQQHGDDSLGASPLAQLCLQRVADVECLQVAMCYQRPQDAAVSYAWLGGDGVRYARGDRVHIDWLTIDGHGGLGRIRFTVNGKPLCDYRGPTGFATAVQPSYWKLGLHRGVPTDPTDGAMVLHIYNPQILRA